MMDLSIILQLMGDDVTSAATRPRQSALRQLYHLPPASGKVKLRLLAS